ncbi:hypothetical protein BBJ28_00013706 [Nothophytophthora sp. Chile5]|nr:hypothetical protein BBJ28_00013706 [Nothophytophthora sp. Chile5]
MTDKRRKKKEGRASQEFGVIPETQIGDGNEESMDDQGSSALPATTAPKRRKRASTKKIATGSMKTQTRTDRPKRKKFSGTIKEEAFKKRKGYCSVVCRLETICSDPNLCEEIRRSAHAMKQIQLEAWHLVNLHALRCLGNGLPLPDFSDATFFDNCCSGVATTCKTSLIAQKDPDLWEAIKIYQSQRGRTGLIEVDHLTGYSNLKAELRAQMVVNAGVMIREHFRQRLKLYVGITFGDLGSSLTKKQKKEKADLVKAIMHACYSADEMDVAEAEHMRDVLAPDGTEWTISLPIKTSKLCSQCHQTLSSVRYSVDSRLPKRRKRKGVVLARNRAEVELKQKKCHAVLRCDHKQCEARYWDRDVNAVINMLELFKSEVLGLGRMKPFTR